MAYRLDITKRLHERFLDIVRTALPLITSSMKDADLAGLAHLRAEMIETTGLYERHVRDRREEAQRICDPRLAAAAEALLASCEELRAIHDGFRERWVYRRGIENWYEYRLSAIVMMKQIRNHVQKAERIGTADPARAA